MRAGGNAESVTMIMVLAISAWLSVTMCGQAQEQLVLAPDTEVFVYDMEQVLVDSMTVSSDRQPKQKYRNDLDRSLSVLLRRACPKLKRMILCNKQSRRCAKKKKPWRTPRFPMLSACRGQSVLKNL